MATEKHVLGPPGCGKTTYICNNIIKDMADQYGEDRIMITSFTRTAAIEIATRAGLGQNDKHGTLHSISYAALGRPPLVNTVIKDWNDQYPQWTISSSGESVRGKDRTTELLHSEYNINRNLMLSEESWSSAAIEFKKAWEDFKQQTHTIDFTDMIIMGKERFPIPPFNTSVIIVDEAQDFSPLQIELVRSWSLPIHMVWFVYDDDQAIFSFQGVDISRLLVPLKKIPPENKIILNQSYRVPQKPHAYAQEISSMIQDRDDKVYKPTTTVGEIIHGDGGCDTPEWCINRALKEDGSSMIMASCAYMLSETIGYLKSNNIPFHNPYKKEERLWNPLDNKITDILYAFLSEGEDPPYWSTSQILDWLGEIKVFSKKNNCFGKKRGINKMLEILEKELQNGTEGLHTSREYLADLLSDEALEPALNRDLKWFQDTILGKYQTTLKYPIALYEKHGKNKEILKQTPKIMIGTIHSFKGCEADNVFIYPDMSYAAMNEYDSSVKGKDDTHRLYYVAVTRTKNKLFIMQPSRNSRGLYYDFPTFD